MQGTLAIVKLTDADSFRVIFYGTEMPEGMNAAAAYVAKGIEDLGRLLDAIGVHADKHPGRAENGKLHQYSELLRVR